VNGSVSAFVSGGLTPARVGGQIAVDTRVVTGARSTARVQVDGCVVDIPANSDLEVSVVRNRICVALQLSGSPAGAGGASGGAAGAAGAAGTTIPTAAIAGGVLGLGAVGGIIAVGGNDNNGVVVVPPVSD
jgi:hypothetical protein